LVRRGTRRTAFFRPHPEVSRGFPAAFAAESPAALEKKSRREKFARAKKIASNA
jgi:hypothetical protein